MSGAMIERSPALGVRKKTIQIEKPEISNFPPALHTGVVSREALGFFFNGLLFLSYFFSLLSLFFVFLSKGN